MDPQSPQQSHHQHEKVEVVAQELLKAFNSDSQNDSNIIIFLSKLYKNNSPLKNKKMKSIRLNQFIDFLQHVVNDFPSTKEDTELLYCSVLNTLTNDKNFTDDEDYELIESIGYEIAKVIEKLTESQFSYLGMKLLSYLINSENITESMMEIPVFDETLKNSKYFQTITLDQSQNTPSHHIGHEDKYKWHILQQLPILTIILDSLNVEKVYSSLFNSSEQKLKVVGLFYEHVKKLTRIQTKSKREIFIDCFITSQQKLSKCQVEAILKIMQKQAFDRETINEVVSKITQEKVSLQDLIEIEFKNIKGVEQVFVQCLIQQSSKKSINELIELFLSMKSEQNYFPLYLILKQNQKVPIDYVSLFFEENQLFTVRKGIIYALSIVDNELSSFGKLMRCFKVWNGIERIRTRSEYNNILKSVHLSLQNVSKANVVSHILRHIHKQNLNKQCKLQFIIYNSLRVSRHQQMKNFINQQTRSSLSTLFRVLSEFEGMTKTGNNVDRIICEQMKSIEWQHKYRIDLEFLLSSNPYIEQEMSVGVKELNKLMVDGAVGTEQLLRQLPLVKQALLQVPLMWLNNKLQTFYQQQANPQTVDWAVKTYKKLTTDLSTQLKSLLQKQKLQPYYKLIKTLIQYTIEKQQPITIQSQLGNKIFHHEIIQLINSAINTKEERMNSNNFNDYFLSHSAYKHYLAHNDVHHPLSKLYKKIIWIKTLLIQTKMLIKNIVKAEKLSNRKEIKNIIADNVADVLAFKVIHQYFDAQVQQAPEILIDAFRNIQPDMQFFEKTEALASSLNIQFYSIFEELPNLLQNFNSDTLIFLSKLIFNPKPQGEEKKKTTKKKKDKDTQPQDSICLTVIAKNFQLLFGNPNQMESFKSLFVILRKLIESEKVNPQQFEKHLNNWLSEINFISCANFQSWKNKVLSLSKMWRIAADLLSDKKIEKNFQLSVLEKHFNLFTDLLNKLYENFREQPEFLEIQQRILLSLCLIYKNQDFSQIIEEQNSMVEFMIKRFQQRNMSRIVLQNKFYFCHQCKKNACYACSSFLHRNHDKNFLGKTGICEHEASGAHKSKKQTLLKAEYSASILGGVSAILKKNEDLPQDVLERISQKLLHDQQLRANEDGDYIGRFRDPQVMRQLLQSRLSRSKGDRTEQLKRKLREKENLFMKEIKKEDEEELEEDQKTMTPEAEEYFQYKESYCKQFKKIHSQFMFQSPKIKKIVPKINTSPLARVFLRELQENHFYNEERCEKTAENASSQSINVEQIKEKYQFFKNNNLKAESGRDFGFGRGRGGYGGGLSYGQNPRENLNSHRRNIIACNKKYMLLPSNMSIMNLSMAKLREKLEKKIQNKEFNNIEQEKNYVSSPTVNLPFQIFELMISNSPNNPCIAIVGYNQLCFYTINADGRFGRQMNPEFSRIDNIVKFSWINEKKNLFAIAFTNYIRIGGISSNNNIKPFSKAQIGKTIRDFDGYINSRTYVLFILDTEGKLYYIDVDFKQGKSTAYSPQDRIITLKDENGVIIKEEIYSVKSIDGNRLLISFPSGVVRIAQTSRQSNIWTTKKLDLKKVMKIDSLLVLQAMKIIKFDDQSVTFGAIGRKLNAFQSAKTRKCAGQLMLVTFNTQNVNLSSVYFTKEENIESYDMSVISSGQMIVVSLNDEGAVHMFKHGVDVENKQIVERINAVMDNGSVRALCRKLLASEFFSKVEQGGMLRNLQFKQNKPINNSFTINTTTTKSQILIRESHPHSNFISGISFQIQLPSSVTQYNMQDGQKQHEWVVELRVKLLESSYVFKCSSKLRQIQLGLNIKQSVELFTLQNQVKITYEVVYNEQVVDVGKLTQKERDEFVKVKNIQIYGFEAKDLYTNNNNNYSQQPTNTHQSPYHVAFRQLFNDWHTYQQYIKQNFQQYLLNPYRQDFYNIDIKKLFKLKHDHSQYPNFKSDQINLLLKLELLSQTLSSDKCYTKENLQDYLIAYRKLLLSKQYPRKSLENSVYRVGYSLCELYEKHVPVGVGHPYHGQSMISLHMMVNSYQRWQQRKNLLTFDKLCTTLSNLIFTSAINLHIILQCLPQLIIQLSQYFRQLITGHKHRQFSQQQSQVSLTRTCSRYIGIVCEYYQVMKNKGLPKIQEKMLYLLQQVFGQCKNDMPKQLVMNPFLYLQSIFSFNQQIQLQSTINIYSIQQNKSIQGQSESFYALDKKNKEKLMKKNQKNQQQRQLQRGEVKVEEEQRLLRDNSRWEAIVEEEKDMEEEQNEMYMEIEEEFDDQEELELVADQVEVIDTHNRKQSLNNQQPFVQNQPQLPTTPLIPNLQQKIAKTILSHCNSSSKKLTINHYDFPFQLAIALFRKQHYLNQSNIYFYLGLLYNLLKIIQNNLKISVNKSKILEFIEMVDQRVQEKEYASLFIVLNFFITPKYHKVGHKECHVHKSLSTLSQHFANYYKQNMHRFTKLLTTYNPKQTHPIIKFSSIMRFTKFQSQNELYNLRFIANIYLTFRLQGYNIPSLSQTKEGENIKQQLLFKLVKYKLPVLKNIMLYEKWQEQLDRAKVLVGFEMILSGDHQQIDKQKGIDMLYSCAHDKPERFVQQLLKDQSKINFLEEYALQNAELNEKTQTKILELLEIYYNT